MSLTRAELIERANKAAAAAFYDEEVNGCGSDVPAAVVGSVDATLAAVVEVLEAEMKVWDDGNWGGYSADAVEHFVGRIRALQAPAEGERG